MVKAAVSQNGYAVGGTPFTGDKEIMMMAVKTTGRFLKHAQWNFTGCCFQDDEELTIAAVQQDGIALPSAAKKYWVRLYITMSAVKSTLHAFQYMSPRLEESPSFQFTAFCLTGENYLMGPRLGKSIQTRLRRWMYASGDQRSRRP